MKHLLIVLLCSVALGIEGREKINLAENNKNSVVLSVGYGAPSIIRTFLKKNNNHQDYKIMGYGPYMFKGEYFINSQWTVGFNFTYSFSRLSWMGEGYDTVKHDMGIFEYGIEMEDYSLLLRSNYHFSPKKRFDKYVGFGIGYGRIAFGTYTEAPVNQFSVGIVLPRPLSIEATFGLRYAVTRRFGIYSEIGLGKSWILFNKYFIPESLIQAGMYLRVR